jgi:hypothetical protein
MMTWLFDVYPMVLELIFSAVIMQTAAGPLPSSPDQKGVASRFGDPGDKWVGGNLYCQPNKRVDSDEHVCAHRLAGYRSHPCGTILILRNPRTKKMSWCRIMDRGPYGADVLTFDKDKKKYTQAYYFDKRKRKRKQWYIKIRYKDGPPAAKCPSGNCAGRWRGYLDLSPKPAVELGHNGMERIHSWKLDRVLRYQKQRRLLEEKKAARRNRPKT